MRSSVVVGLFSLLGGLTGILVETTIAAKLGLSKSSDTFYVAVTAPYIITNLLSATGQFSLVPFFASFDVARSADQLWRGFSYAVNVVFLGLSAVAVAGAAATPWIIRGIAPGFTRPQTELAIQLGQWLFLMIIPAGVAEVFRSFLLSQRRFALPSAAGFFRNATMILVILFTFDRYGHYSIVLGYFAGYFLQLAILAGQILVGFTVRYSLTLVGSGEAFRNLHGAGRAQVGTALAYQSVVLVERMIASFLPAGTLTALNYGFKILSALADLFAGSVGTVALAPLSQAVVRKAEAEERRTFHDALEISLVLVSPVMIFCLLLARNIIRLTFQHGNFTPAATALMSKVFFYYSLSLLAFAAIRVLTFYLFARQEVGWFVRLSLLQFGLNIAFDLLYVGALRMGPKGIPLGLLTSLIVTSGLAVRRNLANLRSVLDRPFGIFAAKTLLGSVLAALTVWGLRFWIKTPGTGWENFLYVCLLCGTGSLVFGGALAASKALALSELATVRQSAADL